MRFSWSSSRRLAVPILISLALPLATPAWAAADEAAGASQADAPEWEDLPWDERLGVAWYERRAATGDIAAMVRAAVMHERGIGTATDPAEAARWYAMAAAEGHPLAQFKTARAWQLGLLGAPDAERAAVLYEKAAESGIGLASFNLAVMAETGQGMARDRARAADLYRRAWGQGIAKAALNLGVLLLGGQDPDPARAYAWLAAAAAAGVEEAEPKRVRLAEILGPDLVAEAQRVRLPRLGES